MRASASLCRPGRLLGHHGIGLVELMLSILLTSIIATAGFYYYKSQHEVYLAQTSISDRQGNLRASLDELKRQVRRAGYLVPGGGYARLSAKFDTLEVYIGQNGGATVDTLRYFVTGTPRALVRQTNKQAPQVFAENVDSATFVQIGAAPLREVAIALVSSNVTGFGGTSLSVPRRVGTRVQLRNR